MHRDGTFEGEKYEMGKSWLSSTKRCLFSIRDVHGIRSWCIRYGFHSTVTQLKRSSLMTPDDKTKSLSKHKYRATRLFFADRSAADRSFDVYLERNFLLLFATLTTRLSIDTMHCSSFLSFRVPVAQNQSLLSWSTRSTMRSDGGPKMVVYLAEQLKLIHSKMKQKKQPNSSLIHSRPPFYRSVHAMQGEPIAEKKNDG